MKKNDSKFIFSSFIYETKLLSGHNKNVLMKSMIVWLSKLRASRSMLTPWNERASICTMIGLIRLARPLRAWIRQVNQVKIDHGRVDRAITKTILLSLQEFSIGGVSRAKKPCANERSTRSLGSDWIFLWIKLRKEWAFLYFLFFNILNIFFNITGFRFIWGNNIQANDIFFIND